MRILIKIIFSGGALFFDSEEYPNSFDFDRLGTCQDPILYLCICPYLYLKPVSVFVSISGTVRFLTSSYFDRLPRFHCVQLTMADLIKISSGKATHDWTFYCIFIGSSSDSIWKLSRLNKYWFDVEISSGKRALVSLTGMVNFVHLPTSKRFCKSNHWCY